jgi:hypothetical protein
MPALTLAPEAALAACPQPQGAMGEHPQRVLGAIGGGEWRYLGVLPYQWLGARNGRNAPERLAVPGKLLMLQGNVASERPERSPARMRARVGVRGQPFRPFRFISMYIYQWVSFCLAGTAAGTAAFRAFRRVFGRHAGRAA